jgi:aspartyl protease family protein
MKNLLAILVLFSIAVEFVRGDSNIYGPDGVNLGPNPDPELVFPEIEQQRQKRQLEQRQRQQKKAIDHYNSGLSLTLSQKESGHYFVDGAINDIPIVFAIDTGASFVTLPGHAASKAGIQCENDAVMETANGKAKGCAGIIAKLKFGDFMITDVRCLIAPNLNQALLGNNVLKEFKIIQNTGEMRITK